MRQLMMSTAVALVLAASAHAQVSVGTNTAAGAKVGNAPSTVRVDGNSTVRTFNDGTSSVTRPANDAVDNTRLGTEVRSSTTVSPQDQRSNSTVDVNAGSDARNTVNTTTRRAYDPATGVTRSVTGTTNGVMGSVTDTIKGPLDSGASVSTTTSGSVGN